MNIKTDTDLCQALLALTKNLPHYVGVSYGWADTKALFDGLFQAARQKRKGLFSIWEIGTGFGFVTSLCCLALAAADMKKASILTIDKDINRMQAAQHNLLTYWLPFLKKEKDIRITFQNINFEAVHWKYRAAPDVILIDADHEDTASIHFYLDHIVSKLKIGGLFFIHDMHKNPAYRKAYPEPAIVEVWVQKRGWAYHWPIDTIEDTYILPKADDITVSCGIIGKRNESIIGKET